MKSTLSNQGGWLCGLELTMSPNRILTAILLHSCGDWLSFLAGCVIRGVIIITEASLCGWTDVIIKCKLCPCAVTTFNGWRFSGYYIYISNCLSHTQSDRGASSTANRIFVSVLLLLLLLQFLTIKIVWKLSSRHNSSVCSSPSSGVSIIIYLVCPLLWRTSAQTIFFQTPSRLVVCLPHKMCITILWCCGWDAAPI